jgi:hypothetical protein
VFVSSTIVFKISQDQLQSYLWYCTWDSVRLTGPHERMTKGGTFPARDASFKLHSTR